MAAYSHKRFTTTVFSRKKITTNLSSFTEKLAPGRLDAAPADHPFSINMYVASCSASPRTLRLLPAHGCSFVLHVCCHTPWIQLCAPRLLPTHACSFASAARLWMQLRAPRMLPRPWIQLRAPRLLPRPLCFPRDAGTVAPEGTTFACASLPLLLMKHLQHTSETDETFTTYVCNICLWAPQHMQHPDKTLATYV
jgi:hypothetical protein